MVLCIVFFLVRLRPLLACGVLDQATLDQATLPKFYCRPFFSFFSFFLVDTTTGHFFRDFTPQHVDFWAISLVFRPLFATFSRVFRMDRPHFWSSPLFPHAEHVETSGPHAEHAQHAGKKP